MRTRYRRSFLPLVLLVLTAAFAIVSDALKRGEQSLIDRRYPDAVAALRDALEEVGDADRPRVLLLLGRAQWLAGDLDAAVETYRRLIANHPDHALASKAELQQAEALSAARRHQEAAELYRRQIERLTGPERKEEIASTYLGLADKALGSTPPDPARAVTFYDLALDLGLSAEKARSVRLLAAEALLQAGRHAEAVQRLDSLVDELDLGEGKLRAMLALGRARAATGDRGGARVTLRDLVALSPESPEAADATWEIAKTYGVPSPDAAVLDRAIGVLRELAAKYPEHPKARIADYLIARCLLGVGRSAEGLAALRAFVEARADERLDEVAQARASIGDVLISQRRIEEAIAAWRDYLQAHPAHEEWERVQRAIVDAEFRLAVEAAEQERYEEARELFERFIANHPLDERNPEILFRIGETYAAEKKWEHAREAFERCVSKYPGRPTSSHAQFRIGEIHEKHEFDYQKALAAYRAVTWGPWQHQAQIRIAKLERKHLHLRTERSFRSGETPEFHVVSRNIPSVRVRVYQLDLETWFRATHTSGQVERLDIEVIEPDRTFQSEVPQYLPHKETDRTVELEFDEPGAYVVKVDDQELEATTMVLVTDLGIIAKSSRHEFFVFAQNLKEDRIEGGVRVALSDGDKIVAEGVTDESGVWRYRGEALRDHDSLRVFAVDGAGSGASTLDLSGLGYSEGLAAKSYLFTDRPAYLPGETVHVKGIVREVREGRYVMPADEAGYRARILSSSGRLLLDREVEFTDFGTFAVDLELPGDVELGVWRATVTRGGSGQTFEHQFQVARFELPRLSLTAEAERRVVFRGEEVRGRFVVRHFYGEPAVGRTVEYSMRLPDGSVLTRQGRTNAAGEVAFSFDTQEFSEEGMALVIASVAEANASTSVAVPVVTTEVQATVSTLREVYLAGEPFDVRVELKDRSGEAVARAGTLTLFRIESGPRGSAEIEVAKREVRTVADSGAATLSMTAEKGGAHVVRFETVDRFGNPISAEHRITISGEDDEVELRLLTDRERYRVGEEVVVKVVNRAAERLALRTVQGDGVLAHEAVRLPLGESEMTIVLGTEHAPNFALSLSMIDGRDLHVADRELLVERDLQVELRPARDVATPGEPLEVEVVTRDSAGRPVAAELAIAIVEEPLFDVYPDALPDIGAWFWGQRRETTFRTTSSCDWSYEGSARPVSEALVAEERRRAEAAREPQAPMDGDEQAGARGPGTPGPSSPQDRATAAFDSNQWNSAVGLGGGRGGAMGQADELQVAYLLRFAASDEDAAPQLDLLAQVEEQLELAAQNSAAPDQPRRTFSTRGGWVSTVRTHPETGRATVTLAMPDSSSEWRLTAHAVTADTDVGDTRTSVRTVRDLVVSIAAPATLTEGDAVDVRTQLHNRTGEERVLPISWRGAEVERITLEPGGESIQPRRVVAEGAGDVELVLASDDRVLASRTIPVRPFGIEHRDGRSGLVDQSVRWTLSLPEGREYEALTLRVEIGPDPGRDLVAAALGIGFRPSNCRHIDVTNHATASRGIGAIAVLGYLSSIGGGEQVDVARLEGLVVSSVQQLVAVQNEDGSFAWVGRGAGDISTTAHAARLLALARQLGHREADAALDRATDWLLTQLPRADTEDRVDAAFALAEAGRAGFETLNSLHRQRAQLELGALARLSLAWRAVSRRELAAEADMVAREKLSGLRDADALRIEAVALATASRLAADPRDPLANQALDWLRAQRRGATWGTPAATAAALQALVQAGGDERSAADEARVRVTVNGEVLAEVTRETTGTTLVFTASPEAVRAQGDVVEIAVDGRGRVHCSAVLAGFSRGIREDDRRDDLVHIRRRYLPALLRHDGKTIAPGFSVVDRARQTFTNSMSELPVGSTGRAEVEFYVRGEGDRPWFTPVIVEEPIPAGCIVPRDSIQGGFDHVEVLPDRLLFYYREGRRNDVVRYEITGRFSGSYRVLPTAVYGAVRPDLVAYGPDMSLRVLERGESSSDEYRMSPDELYALGKARYDAGDLVGAGELLDELVSQWKLRQDIAREVARMMLFVSIERDRPADVVRWFEDLKDRYPELVIPFENILAVGQSYIDIGEFEAAVLVFRATAEASFLKEAAVATTLERLGEVRASVRFLRRLLATYPDLNTMRQSLYGIGQKLGLIAARMSDEAPVDERVGRRHELQRMAVEAFRDFLIMYPEDPLAEEVAFSWATTLIEMRELEAALDVASGALSRYPESTLEDEFLYTVGFARFVGGEPREAFDVLERVASEEFARQGGGRGPSQNRDHAIYLEGQIFHALGEPAEALQRYDAVRDDFSDAREAAEFFRERELVLPEVVRFGLEEPAKVVIGHRNLEELTIKVYRVDLMRLYLMQKSLNDIRDIQLHGIRPHWEETVDLGDTARYVEHERAFELPIDEPGAYLVVARAEDLIASGMALRSDLSIEMQESFDVGRVRVNVKRNGAFVPGAHVKVVGSGDGRLQGGDTDPRGVFVANDVVGRATVIVRMGDSYAFFRGEGLHQPARVPPPPPMRPQQQSPAEAGPRKDFDAWKNNIDLNNQNRARQIQWLEKEVLQKDQKGVEVYRAK